MELEVGIWEGGFGRGKTREGERAGVVRMSELVRESENDLNNVGPERLK